MKRRQFLSNSLVPGALLASQSLAASAGEGIPAPSGGVYPQTRLELAAGVRPPALQYLPGDVRRYGAVGDGVSDDTRAIQDSLRCATRVSGNSGDTYLVAPLVTVLEGQVIDFSGCTLKLRPDASTYLLHLKANGIRLVGGTFDGSRSATQARTAGYEHATIAVSGDGCVVENCVARNVSGIGIKGIGCSAARIRANRVTGCGLHGIYVESTTADAYDNCIEDNYVELDAGTNVGLYLIGKADLTFRQRRFRVTGNIVVGPRAGTTNSDICITVRGEDGVIAENQTARGSMGISADSTARAVISGNRIGPTNGGYGYGIECNGGRNSITGNYIAGCTYGIIGSGSLGMDGNAICGNVIEACSSRCIYIVPSVGSTANYLAITGNTMSVSVGAGRNAVYLANDCRYALISSNIMVGPGSRQPGARAVMCAGVNSHVRVVCNTVHGWSEGLSMYSADAVAQSDLTFSHNDCSRDMGPEALLVNVVGSARFGPRIQQMFNAVATGAGPSFVDRAAGIAWMQGAGMPEGERSAGVGSWYQRVDGGHATSFYVKESGSGNTGWVGK